MFVDHVGRPLMVEGPPLDYKDESVWHINDIFMGHNNDAGML